MSRSLGTNSGSFEPAHSVRLRPVRLPDPLHRRDADADRLGLRPAGPMRRFVGRIFRCQGDDLLDYSRIERFAARRTGFVTQQTVHALPHEPFLPAPYDGFGAPSAAHDPVRAQPLRRQQDDFCSPDMFLRAVAVRHHCPKTGTVGAGHIDDDPLAHPPDSHAQGKPGILKGTRTSGWMH